MIGDDPEERGARIIFRSMFRPRWFADLLWRTWKASQNGELAPAKRPEPDSPGQRPPAKRQPREPGSRVRARQATETPEPGSRDNTLQVVREPSESGSVQGLRVEPGRQPEEREQRVGVEEERELADAAVGQLEH